MKKFLIFSNILLLAVIGYLLSDKYLSKGHEPPRGGYPEEHIPGLITYDAAKLLAEDYKNNPQKSKIFEGPKDRPDTLNDTKVIWYDIKRIKAYIDAIEKAAHKSGKDKRVGLHLYFGIYPDEETMRKTPSLKDVPPQFANRLTLFWVPTIWNGKENVDFNPFKSESFEDPIFLKDSINIKSSAKRKSGGDDDDDDDDGILNHGDLIPPPPDGGDFGN